MPSNFPRDFMTPEHQRLPSICFVGLGNISVLAPELGHHGAGGAEVQQTLLARALVAKGYDVSMVVMDYGQPDGAVWDGIKTYKAHRPHDGLPVLRFIHPRWTGLWAAMRRARADVYYTSCAGAQVAQVTMFARQHGAKAIFRVASNTDCDPKALLVRYWRDKQLYRWGLQHADMVLAQTPEQAQALLKNFRRDSRVAPSMTDARGRRLSLEERDISVLWVGNMRPLKRPELILEAARKLPHLSFHIIGGPMPGSEAYFEQIRAQAAEVPNVTFHGPIPYHAVGEFYERARLFAGTSEIEGFPNTYLQAWARGTPVVAFLDPDQLIARHGMGRAVGSVSQLCEAIATLSADAAAWQTASRRATTYMDERFDLTRMVAPFEQAIRAVADESGRVPAAQPPCKSVLMVGTDLNEKGGIRAVVQGYMDGGLFDRFDGTYVVSHVYGSAWRKIATVCKAWLRVAYLLHKLDTPLVHVHMASRASFWRKSVVCLLARMARRPYVVHLHGAEFADFYGKEAGPLVRWAIRSNFAHAAVVIALSEEWRQRVLRICPTTNVEVLHNAVPIPDISAAVQVRRSQTTQTMLFLGHLSPHKGIFDLVRAFANIAPRFPQARLVLGGVGQMEEIGKLARELNVETRVSCPGWLTTEQKCAKLAESTVFILPSYAEGMPMALLEAMSWGLPVVATPVGGVPQVVDSETNGLMVQPGDVTGLTQALTRLLESPELRQRLGAAARHTVETRFDLRQALDQLTLIYRRFGLEARAVPATAPALATAGDVD
jgi:glycosyltransferase involved in cell wall biosynthesis